MLGQSPGALAAGALATEQAPVAKAPGSLDTGA
jgi:hypothetical protein